MITTTIKRTDLELTKLKNTKNTELFAMYRRLLDRIDDWAEDYDIVDHQSHILRYRVKAVQSASQEQIAAWKRETPDSIINTEWKNIIATHQKWADITQAFFNIVEAELDDYVLTIEDLFKCSISPKPYLNKDLKTGELKPIEPEDALAQLVQKCSKYTSDYYTKKRERDEAIKHYQNEETSRNTKMMKSITDWRKEHKNYDIVGEWMFCLAQLYHARIWNIVSLLSTRKEMRLEQLGRKDSMVNKCESEVHKVMGEFSNYTSAIIEKINRKKEEEERKIREAEEEAERLRQEVELLRQEAEEEYKRREAEEERKRKEAEEERKRKEVEAQAEADKHIVAAMIPKLQDKFNTPKKNNKQTPINNNSTNTVFDGSPVESKKEKKQMTKAKEIKKQVEAQPIPAENMVIETIDINLSDFGFEDSRIDTTKDYNIYLDGNKVWLSDALGTKLYDSNVFTVCFKENKGAAFLVFGDKFNDVMEQDDKQRFFIESDNVTASIRKTIGCNDSFQAHTYKLGKNNGMVFVNLI